jgi:hypothetical protein
MCLIRVSKGIGLTILVLMKTGLEIQLKDPTYPTMVRECQLTGSSAGHLAVPTAI